MANRILSCLCSVAASLYVSFPGHVGLEAHTSYKFDEFGQIPCAQELTRLDSYGLQLKKLRDVFAVVAVIGGESDTREGEVVARLFGIRDYLIERQGLDRNRIVLLEGGFSEELRVQLWILPSEAREGASSIIDHNLSAKNPRLRKPAIRKWKYTCEAKLN
jgi:hypothetical protein